MCWHLCIRLSFLVFCFVFTTGDELGLIDSYLLLLLDVEKMVSLKGMIIRCSSIIPEIREAVFRCLVCGYYSDPIVVERGNSLLRNFHCFICGMLL